MKKTIIITMAFLLGLTGTALAGKNERVLKKIVKSVPGFEGEGFPVNRAFINLTLQDLDPFIMMDEMGAVEYEVGESDRGPVATNVIPK